MRIKQGSLETLSARPQSCSPRSRWARNLWLAAKPIPLTWTAQWNFVRRIKEWVCTGRGMNREDWSRRKWVVLHGWRWNFWMHSKKNYGLEPSWDTLKSHVRKRCVVRAQVHGKCGVLSTCLGLTHDSAVLQALRACKALGKDWFLTGSSYIFTLFSALCLVDDSAAVGLCHVWTRDRMMSLGIFFRLFFCCSSCCLPCHLMVDTCALMDIGTSQATDRSRRHHTLQFTCLTDPNLLYCGKPSEVVPTFSLNGSRELVRSPRNPKPKYKEGWQEKFGRPVGRSSIQVKGLHR